MIMYFCPGVVLDKSWIFMWKSLMRSVFDRTYCCDQLLSLIVNVKQRAKEHHTDKHHEIN